MRAAEDGSLALMESYGDELYESRRWAIDAAKDYATDEGIALVPRDADLELQSEG